MFRLLGKIPKVNFRLSKNKITRSLSYVPVKNSYKLGGLFLTSSIIIGSSAIWSTREPIDNDIQIRISVDEVMKHNTIDDCWIAINGLVFDVTRFLISHPGGAERIFKYAGKDASGAFSQIHSTEVLDKMVEHIECLGKLDGDFEIELTDEQKRIEENMKHRPDINLIYNLNDFEFVAKQVLPEITYYYFTTGASDQHSVQENSNAYNRVFFRPKVLQDIADPDLRTEMLGNKVELPIYVSGFAGSKFAHPLGEKNLQKVAYERNIIEMVPKHMGWPFHEFFSEVPKDQKMWYQLQFDTQEELDVVDKTLAKIEATGNVKGIFVNVDLADLGNREKDSKKRVEDAAAAAVLATVANNGKVNFPQRFTWNSIKHIQSLTDLPICLKGVQRGEDVVLAAMSGIKAVVLSNHGGRQLDFSRPPLEVLAEAKTMLKEKNLEDKIEIYIDGGIRRGSDILKALCLGAKGVGMGRPFLYAMASYGEDGVRRLFDILETEMINNMKLLGVDKIEDLNEDLIDISNLKFRGFNNTRLEYPRFSNNAGIETTRL
ncbi:cytochrome b2, mitochondrial [[Candida] jaroonii]|uniref:Cytochrome b2, mitochondrial n=1 Tax=[Candida] jaroonii TaxID=467808 RepID=A0ACA9Y9B7_9ASCO|nr:cytochrome b2, mitochondrial [[Candida] jaroonii]